MLSSGSVEGQHSDNLIFLERDSIPNAHVDYLEITGLVYRSNFRPSITMGFPFYFVCVRKTYFFGLLSSEIFSGFDGGGPAKV